MFDAVFLVRGAALRLGLLFRLLLVLLVFLLGGSRSGRGFVFLALRQNPRQHAADGDHLSLGRDVRAERAFVFRFEIEIHLVGLDLRKRLALLHGVARLFVPADDFPLGHRIAHLGHDDFSHWRT